MLLAPSFDSYWKQLVGSPYCWTESSKCAKFFIMFKICWCFLAKQGQKHFLEGKMNCNLQSALKCFLLFQTAGLQVALFSFRLNLSKLDHTALKGIARLWRLKMHGFDSNMNRHESPIYIRHICHFVMLLTK